MKKLIILCLTAIPLFSSAQYRDHDSNHIGINIGLNHFTPNTNDVNATPGTGWNAGLSVRGNFYNNFDMIYGIQFSENKFSVAADGASGMQEVEYKLSGAQVSLLLSYEIVESHFSIEIGPMIQINGDLTYNENYESYILEGTDLIANDIVEVSRFNFYPTVGFTAGLSRLRLSATYQYGINNLMKANGVEMHGGILAGNIIFYL